MSAITDLIAEVLRQHAITDKPTWANERICTCGENVRVFPPGLSLAVPCHSAHVAERVEAELNLTEERHWFRTVGGVDGEWQHAIQGWISTGPKEAS